MRAMFNSANAFNQNISGWNVSSVTEMSIMFNDAISFNQNLSDWNVVNVQNCQYFSEGAINWSLPHPTFTNCMP